MRRWKCKICEHIHTGAEPPNKCPICMAGRNQFVEIDADGNKIAGEDSAVSSAVAVVTPVAEKHKPAPAGRKTMLERMAGLVLSLHLHPITVHFPNGILPAVLVAMGDKVLVSREKKDPDIVAEGRWASHSIWICPPLRPLRCPIPARRL